MTLPQKLRHRPICFGRLLVADFQRGYVCFGYTARSWYLHLHSNTDGKSQTFLQAMSDKKARGRQMLRLLNLIE